MTVPDWQPSSPLAHLKKRAEILALVRGFFAKRGVLEVDTPLLCATTATDPFLESIAVPISSGGIESDYYLQTSPEFAMKRLLATGIGSIYQICKSFRAGERGGRHNPEFTMLEWYRPGFDETQLMAEVSDLLRVFIEFEQPEMISYRNLFIQKLDIDPFITSDQDLASLVSKTIDVEVSGLERDSLLDLLITHRLESGLGADAPCFVYDYPASQAALAEKHIVDGFEVGRRFEVYIDGVELANGYFELTDADEQKKRFLEDIDQRRAMGLPEYPLDQRLIEALASGLPACSGVALGFDRLLMKVLEVDRIDEVLAFPFEKA